MFNKKPAYLSALLIIAILVVPQLASATETYSFVSVFYSATDPTQPITYFQSAFGVEVDSSANIYVLDYVANAIKKFSNAYASLPLTLDRTLSKPSCVTVDDSGNIFVSDETTVRKFSSAGIFSTTIGTWSVPNPFYPGFGQPETLPTLPGGTAIDSSGNVYATSPGEHRVHKYAPSGTGYTKILSWGNSLTVINPNTGAGAYLPSAANGEFNQPAGIAVYGEYVYVADSQNERIQKFSDTGQFQAAWLISTIKPGLPNNVPSDLDVDSFGNVFITVPNADCVLKIDSSGQLLATIGVPHATGSTAEGEFDTPMGAAVDSAGYVYVADTYNNRIQKFSPQNGGTTYSFVSVFYSATDPTQPITYFQSAFGVEVDSSANIYVLDYVANAIKKFSNAYASLPLTLDRTLSKPSCVTVDDSGNIFVSDETTVRKFSSAGIFSTTIGTWSVPNPFYPGFGQPETLPTLPGGTAIDSSGNVYATSPGEHRVHKYAPSGTGYTKILSWGNSLTVINPNTGAGAYLPSAANGEFNQPAGIAVYGEYVYVADSQNERIQKFSDTGQFQAAWLISTIKPGLPNNVPSDLDVDSFGNVFITVPNADCVLKIDSSGQLLATIGVPHATGSTAEGEFDTPMGAAVDSAGYVYVADTYNNRIQKFSPPAPGSQPSVVLSLTEGPYGSDFRITCSGFAPYTDVTITLPWGYSPRTYKTDENGVADRLSVVVPTEVTVGPYAITATGAIPTGSGSATAYFTVTPLNSLVFDVIGSPQTVGTPFTIKITATDYQGNVLTSFTGIVTLSCSNGAVISPTLTGRFVDGVWTGNMQIDSAATEVTINAIAPSGATGSSNSFVVAPGMAVPEYPIGALAVIIASLGAFAVYKKHNSHQQNKHQS